MTKPQYKQGERVYFDMGEKLPTGWGKVSGVVGPVIIIELDTPIKGYPFTHTYILDAQIKTPPKEAQSEQPKS